jgi:hypothetical protein
MGIGDSFWGGGIWQGHEDDHLPPSIVKVKNGAVLPSLSYIS